MIVSDGSREREVYAMANDLVNEWIKGLDEKIAAEGGNPIDKIVLSAYATAAYTLYTRLRTIVEDAGGSFTPLSISKKGTE